MCATYFYRELQILLDFCCGFVKETGKNTEREWRIQNAEDTFEFPNSCRPAYGIAPGKIEGPAKNKHVIASPQGRGNLLRNCTKLYCVPGDSHGLRNDVVICGWSFFLPRWSLESGRRGQCCTPYSVVTQCPITRVLLACRQAQSATACQRRLAAKSPPAFAGGLGGVMTIRPPG